MNIPYAVQRSGNPGLAAYFGRDFQALLIILERLSVVALRSMDSPDASQSSTNTNPVPQAISQIMGQLEKIKRRLRAILDMDTTPLRDQPAHQFNRRQFLVGFQQRLPLLVCLH